MEKFVIVAGELAIVVSCALLLCSLIKADCGDEMVRILPCVLCVVDFLSTPSGRKM